MAAMEYLVGVKDLGGCISAVLIGVLGSGCMVHVSNLRPIWNHVSGFGFRVFSEVERVTRIPFGHWLTKEWSTQESGLSFGV